MPETAPQLAIEKALLHELGSSDFNSSWIASVQKLSNHYVAKPDAASPWKETWAREALLSYFHPLNQARAQRVAGKGAELGFFDGIEHLVDLGCGSAAASLGFLLAINNVGRRIKSLELADQSHDITTIAKRLVLGSGLAPVEIKTSQQALEHYKDPSLQPGTLLILSYILTEALSAHAFETLLGRLSSLEAIAILEPSTSEDARKLQALRPILIRNGFHIWGPCTHHDECPLLKDSDRDWCHDRLIPEVPSWWTRLEAGLPMKNKTVTVSYLIARKTPRPTSDEVRVIGDRLDEKTKVRQMICRGPDREFISWFPSRLKGAAEEFDLARGDRFKSNETQWKDPRGIDRSREYRLDLDAIATIQNTLKK